MGRLCAVRVLLPLKQGHIYNGLSYLEIPGRGGLESCTPLAVPYLIVLREERIISPRVALQTC